MELIDSHAHLTFKGLAENIDQVLERSIAAGVTGWVTVGTGLNENIRTVELAEKFDNMYAAIGVHPHDAKDFNKKCGDQLRKLGSRKKVVAIGETGLDFHYDLSERQIQKDVFKTHLEIAQQLNLPVIVHSREAFDETVKLLAEFKNSLKIVIHCFSGDTDQAKKYLEMGCFISFTGVVTFKNAEKIQTAASIVPLDRMMVETDCPYMSPEPVRKIRTCEPAMMTHTAKKLAQIKGISLDKFAEAVTKTTRGFFNLP